LKGRLLSMLFMLALAALTSGTARSQSPALAASETSALSPEALDQLVAQIALYPDELLGQALLAATYPLEVVEAARWREAPAHAALAGDALATKDWDPGVKALVPFPAHSGDGVSEAPLDGDAGRCPPAATGGRHGRGPALAAAAPSKPGLWPRRRIRRSGATTAR